MHSNFWWDQCVWPQKGCRCQSINFVQIQRCRYVYVHIWYCMCIYACAFYWYIYTYIRTVFEKMKKYLHILEKQNAQQMWKTMHWRIDIESTQTCKNKNTTKFKITWMFFEKNMWFQTDRIWFVKNTPSWRCAIMPSCCVQQQTVFFKPYTSRIIMAKTKMSIRKT